MSLLELFCDVDDFMLSFEPYWKASRFCQNSILPWQSTHTSVMRILLTGREQERRRLQRAIEAGALSRDGAAEFPAGNVVPLFRERGVGGVDFVFALE